MYKGRQNRVDISLFTKTTSVRHVLPTFLTSMLYSMMSPAFRTPSSPVSIVAVVSAAGAMIECNVGKHVVSYVDVLLTCVK